MSGKGRKGVDEEGIPETRRGEGMTSAFQSAGPHERGRLIARLLAGAWRSDPPPVAPGDDLAATVAHLVWLGAGAMTWWKIRARPCPHDPAGLALERAYRLHKIEAFSQEVRLRQAIDALRWNGVEPLLGTGWPTARLYAQSGLRPYGDIDIHVDLDRLSQAANTFEGRPDACAWVRLHRGVPVLAGRPFAELVRRAQRLALGETVVRCLGSEDQLRLLCLRFVGRGGRRPLGLCDVAACLESLPAGFDWEYCLHGDARLSAWVRAVIGLATRLLDARVPPVRAREAIDRTPTWIDRIVLEEWGGADPIDRPVDGGHLARWLRQARLIGRGLRDRIPNAIEAAYRADAWPEANRRRGHRLRAGLYVAPGLGRRLGRAWFALFEPDDDRMKPRLVE